ncbi:hypothetical protein BDQ17DRAFT_449636 [Cyathus striatus]|nr:hypothetical protein BDQ17DRAFT_449636 [Cyathus striatus]
MSYKTEELSGRMEGLYVAYLMMMNLLINSRTSPLMDRVLPWDINFVLFPIFDLITLMAGSSSAIYSAHQYYLAGNWKSLLSVSPPDDTELSTVDIRCQTHTPGLSLTSTSRGRQLCQNRFSPSSPHGHFIPARTILRPLIIHAMQFLLGNTRIPHESCSHSESAALPIPCCGMNRWYDSRCDPMNVPACPIPLGIELSRPPPFPTPDHANLSVFRSLNSGNSQFLPQLQFNPLHNDLHFPFFPPMYTIGISFRVLTSTLHPN